MSKQKAGFSSSAGFQSEASRSGFSATLKKDSWGKQDPQLAATFKDPVLGKVAANVQQSQDRKRLIQNFLGNGFPIRLDQNAEVEDLDLKTTVNLPKPRPQTALPPRRDDPFEVKTFSKTQNLLIDDEPNRKFNPPGVLQMRNITYGGIFKKVGMLG